MFFLYLLFDIFLFNGGWWLIEIFWFFKNTKMSKLYYNNKIISACDLVKRIIKDVTYVIITPSKNIEIEYYRPAFDVFLTPLPVIFIETINCIIYLKHPVIESLSYVYISIGNRSDELLYQGRMSRSFEKIVFFNLIVTREECYDELYKVFEDCKMFEENLIDVMLDFIF
jgi:hypothetical protein